MAGAVTRDLFLGGRLTIIQPAAGFRAGIDTVLLAAAVPAEPGQAVLELGCGVATASLCLAARVPDLGLTGLELQPDYARLAQENAAANGVAMAVLCGDLARPPRAVRDLTVDHVLANPPYYQRRHGTAASDMGRETSFADGEALSVWTDTAIRRLRPGGYLTMIQRIERLPEMLEALDSRMGAVEILPLAPRDATPPRLFILRARKGGRTPFTLLPAMVVHEGSRHRGDRESYTPSIAAVLREAAPLPWPRRHDFRQTSANMTLGKQ